MPRLVQLPLVAALLVGGILFLVAPAVAQDAPVRASAWMKDVVEQPVVQEVKGTLIEALQGDPQAIKKMLATYLLPAAVALAILVAGYMVANFLGRVVGQTVAQRVDVTLGKFMGRVVTNGTLILVALGVLGFFGVDVTSFAAILAAAGFAIGMALQGTLSNFAAGIMLLVFRPFRVGDFIEVSGIQGTVDEIDLFTTRLNSRDNRHLIVPNNQVFGSVIENYTRNELRRVDVNVGVAYSADLRYTRQVLSGAVAVIPGAVLDPQPDIYLMNLGDSAVQWQLRVWCRSENYGDVKQRVTAAAKEALDAANIGIPYPQLDLHVIRGWSAARAA